MKPNKRGIIIKWAKTLALELYDLDINVYFDFTQYRAIFRDDNMHPEVSNKKDLEEWALNKRASITFNKNLFTEDDYPPYVWFVIIHELTHHELTGLKHFKNNPYGDTYHTREFKELELKNRAKVEDLKPMFYNEIGMNIDDECDDLYEEEDEDEN